jgi:hypothetical protein
MQPVLRTDDVSLIESAQIALDAEGIPTTLINANSAGLPGATLTLAVTTDADFTRARAIVQTLQPSPRPLRWKGEGVPRVVLLIIVLFALVICGLLLG